MKVLIQYWLITKRFDRTGDNGKRIHIPHSGFEKKQWRGYKRCAKQQLAYTHKRVGAYAEKPSKLPPGNS
jgi:hypothetical protein